MQQACHTFHYCCYINQLSYYVSDDRDYNRSYRKSDDRDYNRSYRSSGYNSERPRLNLLPKTKPEAATNEVEKKEQTQRPSIFGQAKPVDVKYDEKAEEPRQYNSEYLDLYLCESKIQKLMA